MQTVQVRSVVWQSFYYRCDIVYVAEFFFERDDQPDGKLLLHFEPCVGEKLCLTCYPSPSIQPQRLERRLAQVAVEDRVDVLKDIGVDLQELTLVGNGNEGTLGTVVHSNL